MKSKILICAYFWILVCEETLSSFFYQPLTDAPSTPEVTLETIYSICQCDLTPNVCDPLCCCDASCTPAQNTYYEKSLGIVCGGYILDVSDRCLSSSLIHKINVRKGIMLIPGESDQEICIRAGQISPDEFISIETVKSSELEDLKVGAELMANKTVTEPQGPLKNTTQLATDSYIIGDPLRVRGGNPFVLASSFRAGIGCVTGTASSNAKIYKNFDLGKNFTMICDLNMIEVNLDTTCTAATWNDLDLIKSVMNSAEIRERKSSDLNLMKFFNFGSVDPTQFISYDPAKKVCKFVKNLRLDIYFYPVFEENSDNMTFRLTNSYFMFDKVDLAIDNAGGNYLEMKVNFINLTEDDTIESSKLSSGFFPTTLGSIFTPLFDN